MSRALCIYCIYAYIYLGGRVWCATFAVAGAPLIGVLAVHMGAQVANACTSLQLVTDFSGNHVLYCTVQCFATVEKVNIQPSSALKCNWSKLLWASEDSCFLYRFKPCPWVSTVAAREGFVSFQSDQPHHALTLIQVATKWVINWVHTLNPSIFFQRSIWWE